MEAASRGRAASSLLSEVRQRFLPHLVVIAILWPLFSIAVATVMLRQNLVTSGVPTPMLLAGAAGGALKMLPEIAVGIAILLGVSLLISAVLGAAAKRGPVPVKSPAPLVLAIEPLSLFLAAVLGAASEYPALLRHPVLLLLRPFPVGIAVVILGIGSVFFAGALGRNRGGRRGLVFGVLAAALVATLTRMAAIPIGRAPTQTSGSHARVILGIDSISQADDVSSLRREVGRSGGIWYDKAVPPGLLTNSVWPAILLARPPSETGILLIFQNTDWSKFPDSLARRAQKKGCATFAYFESRFTAHVDREAGFDVDRSGPRGWLQPATAAVKNASVLLPILQARLPPIPGAITPTNQTGAFNYDLRRKIREVLTVRSDRSCTFVASHFDYLHQTAFPAMSEMSAEERGLVRSTRAGEIVDPSLEWQFPLMHVDPLQLYLWKKARIQRIIAEELRTTRFLDPRKQNQLVIFSDHGSRRAITEKNFGRLRYHHVLLATFGAEARDPSDPISLLDISELLGLGDPSRPGPAAPVVQYTNATGDEWNRLIKSARLRASGEVSFDPAILRAIGKRLQGYEPYALNPLYFSTPAGGP